MQLKNIKKIKKIFQKNLKLYTTSIFNKTNIIFNKNNKNNIPNKSRVVIVGGGIIGSSVAYHLGKMGWGKDTIVLEQDKITSGTTW